MSRERREIIYSIIIIIVIPLLFVANTVLITDRIKSDTGRTARRNADLINSIVAESSRSAIESRDYQVITLQISALQQKQPGIGSIYIITKGSDGYNIVSHTEDAPTKLSPNDTAQLALVFDQAQSIAKPFSAETTSGKTVEGYNVITPLLKDDKTVEAAISSNVSTADAQELIDKSLTVSFVVTGVSAIIIIVLLFHHLRFVGYAELIRRLKEVNQTMNDFLSVATHELKAPMTIIKGNISNIIDGAYGQIDERVKEPLNTTIKQTDRLGDLVKDLLNVSRIDQGKISFNLQPTDIKAIISTLVTSYTPAAQVKGLQLVYSTESVPLVLADTGRVQEIMTNLIDNAMKYTLKGSVTVSHRIQSNKLVTSVVDTGPGMTAEEQERLFQRFYRVKNDNTKDIPGTGLGLWIIKQYAEKMGGKITVSSIVGVGTEFTLTLPIAKT